MAAATKSNALLVLFQGFNTLDANGPYEVLRKSGMSEVFNVTVAAEDETTKSAEGVLMQRNVPLDQDLVDNIANYDVLVIPGGGARGPNSAIQKLSNDPARPINWVIKAFSELHPRSEGPERIILSVCTGAFFLAKQNLFSDGRYFTTHWDFYEDLIQFNEASATGTGDKLGTLIPARYVDSGLTKNQVRIITAGGISCGIDAALHVVNMRAGEVEARETAELLDYSWRKTEGVQFGKY